MDSLRQNRVSSAFIHRIMMANLLILILFIGIACTGVQTRYHEVDARETWVQLAHRYEVPERALRERNPVESRVGLKKGQKLYIPFELSPKFQAAFTTKPLRRVASFRDEPLAYNLAAASFSWPVKGRLTSHFGERDRGDHQGIDIAAPRGTLVRAARSGHVIYSGNGINGYGNLVILKHSDQFATVYGHLSQRQVRKGQFVNRGTQIGKVGSTGHATGPHLHFEIRMSRRAVNPLLYLQGQYAVRTAQIP